MTVSITVHHYTSIVLVIVLGPVTSITSSLSLLVQVLKCAIGLVFVLVLNSST